MLIRFFMFMIVIFFISCSVPCDKLIRNWDKNANEFKNILDLIKAEYPKNTYIKSLEDVKNKSIKSSLEKYLISSFKIQYSFYDPNDINNDFQDMKYDSTIILTWGKENIKKDLIIRNLIYSFGNNLRHLELMHDSGFKESIINDSIWMQRIKSSYVITYD
jgi:hypothetical protein